MDGTLVRLSGLTGAGKTEALHALAAHGHQVLDLEGLASHRGSAFGGIGLPAQPSHAAFAARVLTAVRNAARDRVLWVEDEGPFIGAVGVPDWLRAALAQAPRVELEVATASRVERLDGLYGHADPDALIAALRQSRTRLGGARTRGAEQLVRRGDVAAAVEVVLPYFDAAYRHRAEAAPGGRRLTGAGSAQDVLELADAIQRYRATLEDTSSVTRVKHRHMRTERLLPEDS